MNLPILFIFACKILSINSYMLFAANIKDFNAVAKQIVPEKLAQKLTQMAQIRSFKSEKKKKQLTNEYIDSSSKETTTIRTIESLLKDINMDELIIKIKEKMGQHLSLKQNDTKTNVNQRIIKKPHHTSEKTVKRYVNNKKNNRDKEIGKNNAQNTMFQGFDLNKRDSYEDYVTPKKDDDIFEDDSQVGNKKNDYYEETTPKTVYYDMPKPKLIKYDTEAGYNEDSSVYKPKEKPLPNSKYYTPEQTENTKDVYKKAYKHPDYDIDAKDYIKKSHLDKTIQPAGFKEYESRIEPRELKFKEVEISEENIYYKPVQEDFKANNFDAIKARTEHLNVDIALTTPKAKKGRSKNPKIQTMIPTKRYFTMNSPNYYASLPTVAEKYDFNESIPEKDRAHEMLKDIGNPPASINGKIGV